MPLWPGCAATSAARALPRRVARADSGLSAKDSVRFWAGRLQPVSRLVQSSRTGSQLRTGMGESRCSMAVMLLNVIAGGRRYIRQAPGEKENPLETVIIKGFFIRGTASDVESEVHYIPVLDDVFLAFQSPLAGFL